jgi:hypothetical protein
MSVSRSAERRTGCPPGGAEQGSRDAVGASYSALRSALQRSTLIGLPLLAALAVRVAAWWLLPYPGQISDEAEYLAAATWLAQGRGFSFYKEWIWTRPPVYLIFLAAHVWLFGPDNLLPIRISQTLISVISVALTMIWATRLAPHGHARRVAILAGWAMALSYGFAAYAYLLLSETLFLALLLAGLLLLTLWAQTSATGWRRAARCSRQLCRSGSGRRQRSVSSRCSTAGLHSIQQPSISLHDRPLARLRGC